MSSSFSRRSFLALTAAAAPLSRAAAQAKRLPVGLEMYSVRNTMQQDLNATVTAVAKMGYEVVEFYDPYHVWTREQAKEMRKLMDGLGIRCHSTHNNYPNFGDGFARYLELNNVLGAKYVVMASSPRATTVDAYKNIAAALAAASEKAKTAGLRVGYHNHETEFQEVEGTFGMAVVAANTPKDVMLQFDVGTCVSVGHDPVAWIESQPGRINSLHLKEWGAGSGADRGYRTLFGEGDCPWLKIFAAAERVGGVEYYLIEQEGSRFPELETAQRCLGSYRKVRGYA
jgi:sugar phosphate isomerase/epimerase